MTIRETTIKRLEGFNLRLGRDYQERELDQAVSVHGLYAAKAMIHARTVSSMTTIHQTR